MSKALEAAAMAIYERSPFRAEIALGEVLTWQRAHELAAQHPQIRLYLDNCFASARAAITAYHRAISEDEDGVLFAIGEAALCELNAMKRMGEVVECVEGYAHIGRAALRELEPKEIAP